MKVVILAGGYGTRLSEETDVRPKPMVEIGGRPILWHIMKIYSQFGFNDFIILLGYKGYFIKEYFSNYFVLWLIDKDMNERNKSRQSIISNILSDLRVKQEIIEVEGDSFKERFLLLIHYGDWLSYWCAIMHNTDPSPVKNIQVLKDKLSKI